ncbi:MAG: nucleotidyltransferase domain-containing protein [candidate division NC10 bacterium]|nr:nucleotidyltransferase domain-containing protein [candidate division NC10 bacterium]
MSTILDYEKLSETLFGKTRRAVLSLLYGHPGEAFYLRQLIRAAGVGLGTGQREVRRLSEAGVIRRMVRGRQVFYEANPECPVYEELKSLVVKTAGVGDLLRTALAPLSERIHAAFIYGSLARGKQERASDVDIMVIGDVSFGEIVSAIGPAQEGLRREINPSVYAPAEFQSKLKANHHFLKTVMKGEKVFLIGDEGELARLAKKRLAR